MTDDRRQLIQLGLFIITFIFTTIAGAEWMFGRFLFYGESPLTWAEIQLGLNFSVPFLLILTTHEFGHYFTAKYHNVKVSLPYYIPLWFGFIPYMPSFGTMGAFIRIREAISSRSNYFDVGVSGPLAGFVVAIVVIWYGFTHLPEPEYIFQIHPEYEQYGLDYPQYVYEDEGGYSLQFGNNLIFWWFENYFLEEASLMPHPNEIMHYPYLLAGYLALFFTALNLLPIGQLDGGHVTFGLFGPRLSRKLNSIVFLGFLMYAGMGWVHPDQFKEFTPGYSILYLGFILYVIYLCLRSMFEKKRDRWMVASILLTLQFALTYLLDLKGYGGWILFALIIGRFLGVYHPPVPDNRELSFGRKVVGWIAIIVFILSFSPQPFIIN